MSDALPPDRAVKPFEAAPTPLRIRIMRMPGTTPAGRDTLEGLSVPRHPSPLITVSGTKWMLDGVPLENTFTPRETPSVPAGESLDYGARHLPLTFSEKEMQAMLRESLANGDQMMFHVSGYLSAAAMLNAMQATGRKQVWDGKRVRFEHGDGLFPDLIPRVKDFGIIVVQNPTHFDVGLLFGPTPVTYKDVQPFRSLLAAGIPLALGSDGPLNPYHRSDHPRAGRHCLHVDVRLRRICGEGQKQPRGRQARRLGRTLTKYFPGARGGIAQNRVGAHDRGRENRF